jgi:N-acetylmuramic acid 6-phosphate etherase
MKSTPEAEFWLNYNKFLRHTLITEQPHDLSTNLSSLCQNNLAHAFNLFQKVELQAIYTLLNYTPIIEDFQKNLQHILHNQQRIFLVGCGASGRLAMLIRRLYSETNQTQFNPLVCVAAGGDISLLCSVEEFEDHYEFGAKQLLVQGYTPNDLVIGLSASGESNFILGALDYAAKNSRHKPYLICNNPIDIITQRNPSHLAAKIDYIDILALDIGAMLLTGSTRLQATTAMQIVLTFALNNSISSFRVYLNEIYQLLANISFTDLAEITALEADIIKNNDYILYTTNNPILGLNLLADTTERSPTFNLIPFENQNHLKPNNFSPFYLSLENTKNPNEVWQQLFARTPICLNWPEFAATTSTYLNGFDLSSNSLRHHGSYLPRPQYTISWKIDQNNLQVRILDKSYCIALPQKIVHQSLVFKLLLNSHSTLMLGRLGFFVGNLMLSLKPSNSKLIDRAIRYIIFILKSNHNIEIKYPDAAKILFQELPKLKPNESIVVKTVTYILNQEKEE